MSWRWNPIPITKWMKGIRIDRKVNVVVMMPAKAFLRLTLKNMISPSKEEILEKLESHTGYKQESLEQYVNYQSSFPGQFPIYLELSPTDNPAEWKVFGHEGRHRVAAMWDAGENYVEVSLILGYSRHRSILDLPPIIRGEAGQGSTYRFFTKNILGVLEANVQERYQYKSGPGADYAPLLIENRAMERSELRSLLEAKTFRAIPPNHLIQLLRENYPEVDWENPYFWIKGTWDPLSELEKCVMREKEDPYSDVTLDLTNDNIVWDPNPSPPPPGTFNPEASVFYYINGKYIDAYDYNMLLCPKEDPKVVGCTLKDAVELFGRDKDTLEETYWSEIDDIEIDTKGMLHAFKRELQEFLLPLGYYPRFGKLNSNYKLSIKVETQL